MTKTESQWICSECGHSQRKWAGKCTKCSNWNTFSEEIVVNVKNQKFESQAALEGTKPVPLNEVKAEEFKRLPTGFDELDRVLGGGHVVGGLTLLGGDPGIGKSTMMLQLAKQFADQGARILYVCGEESTTQTSMRARRLGISSEKIYLYNETIFSNIRHQIETIQPDILVIDSIQIVYKNELPSLPGSVTQVKEIAMECMHIAKGQGITTFLIGHVTKSGELAGPRVLEHIVDTVLDFDGDKQHGYRMLRAAKNRFGPTDEVALFQMAENGLSEVTNPSQIFLEDRVAKLPGSAIIPMMEGSRSILVEVQALVAPSAFSTSSRRCSGIDSNRLALLLAVLEKRMSYQFHTLDVFVSVAGGMKIQEPALDLGLILAIASSFCNQSLPPDLAVIGEVGLGGEVRRCSRVAARVKEAINMGFTQCVIPKKNLKDITKKMRDAINIRPFDLVEEAINGMIG